MELPEIYCVCRVFPFSGEALWEAWTTSAALQAWYHPQDLASVAGSAVSEPCVGGKWSVGIDASQYGVVPYFYGRYLEVKPLELLRHTMHYTESAEAFLTADASTEFHEVTITFRESFGGTEVCFTQFGTMPDGEAELAKAGMESYFDSLGAYLTTVSN